MSKILSGITLLLRGLDLSPYPAMPAANSAKLLLWGAEMPTCVTSAAQAWHPASAKCDMSMGTVLGRQHLIGSEWQKGSASNKSSLQQHHHVKATLIKSLSRVLLMPTCQSLRAPFIKEQERLLGLTDLR